MKINLKTYWPLILTILIALGYVFFAFKNSPPPNDLRSISKLNIDNPGCVITDPKGQVIDLKKALKEGNKNNLIPKGSLMTSECVAEVKNDKRK